MLKKVVNLFVPLVVFLAVLIMPDAWFHMPGLTVLEQRVMALFLLAALCWVLEPVPIYATSVAVIVLELLMISNKGVWFMTAGNGEPGFGKLMSSPDIMATFAAPVIMLFLGGFFLALAATKYKLDLNLARVLLKPFGARPNTVMLGIMGITACFSIFMSNTATTAMMLAILAPVLAQLPEGDPGRTAFALSIPVAANLGGMGTPIGTPPNVIGLKYITAVAPVSFGEWMLFGVPFVAVMLLFAWFVLSRFFPTRTERMVVDIRGEFQKNWRAITVYVTFIVTVLLWVLGGLHGMDANVVGMIPVMVFSLTGIINKQDLKNISWDVLWLVSGGVALGLAMEQTGLAARLVESIPFAMFPPLAVAAMAVFIALLMSTFMSNTATANLLLPLMAALATGMAGLPGFSIIGGGAGLMLLVVLGTSMAMSLPISTPPNALANATGFVDTRAMAKVGIVVGLVGIAAAFGLCCILGSIKFF